MQRRHFMQAMVAGSAATGLMGAADGALAAAAATPASGIGGSADRAYMAGLLQKMTEPVLAMMSQGQLQKKFPLEVSPTWDGRDQRVAYLECFGRLISGAAPWLALPDDGTPESTTRKRLLQMALQSYTHSVDPKSPDRLLWEGPEQTLVDSAYYTNALMRAPAALWEPLDKVTKQRLIAAIKSLRRVDPPYTNWILFAAMNEAWLMSIGEQYDPMRINLAIRKVNEWYVGDGWIKDGETFHFDYYNSYVMYPMVCEILEVLARNKAHFWNGKAEDLQAQAYKRMQRYSEHLERFISPEGTYPPIGRSLTYRTAAFQPLALLAWRKQRDDKVSFRRVHLPRQRENDPEARLFVTLEALGMADSMHAKVLQTWHVDHQRLASDADNVAWAVRNGIDRARFTDAYNSFGTVTRLRNLPRVAINYQVESTPTIIVDGRYLTTPSMVAAANPGIAPDQVFNATLQVVDALIAKTAAAKP